MCVADMAAGQRMRSRQTQRQTATAGAITLPPDPSRLRLVVAMAGSQPYVYTDSALPQGSMIAYSSLGNGGPTIMLRIEDYGQALTGEINVNDAFGGAWQGCVTELLADFKLATEIQQAVG